MNLTFIAVIGVLKNARSVQKHIVCIICQYRNAIVAEDRFAPIVVFYIDTVYYAHNKMYSTDLF